MYKKLVQRLPALLAELQHRTQALHDGKLRLQAGSEHTGVVIMKKKGIERKKYIPTDEEWQHILSTAQDMARDQPEYRKYLLAIQLAERLGLRNSEIRKLNLSNFDFDDCLLNFYAEKTRREEQLYLNEGIKSLVNDYIKEFEADIKRHKGFLFFSAPKTGRKGQEHYVSKVSIDNAWKRILKRAGLHKLAFVDERGCKRVRYRLHDLRAKFCTDLLEKGYPLDKVMKCSRHKNPITLTTYYDRRKALDIQKELLGGIKQPQEKASSKEKLLLDEIRAITGRPESEVPDNTFKEMLKFFILYWIKKTPKQKAIRMMEQTGWKDSDEWTREYNLTFSDLNPKLNLRLIEHKISELWLRSWEG